MKCQIHQVDFKGPNSRGNYWHVQGKNADGSVAFHNIPAEQSEEREPVSQEVVKEPNYMLRCNAMNNAKDLAISEGVIGSSLSNDELYKQRLDFWFDTCLTILEGR